MAKVGNDFLIAVLNYVLTVEKFLAIKRFYSTIYFSSLLVTAPTEVNKRKN